MILTRHHSFSCSANSSVSLALWWRDGRQSMVSGCWTVFLEGLYIKWRGGLTLPHRVVGTSSYSVAKGGEKSGRAPSFRLPLSESRVYFLISEVFCVAYGQSYVRLPLLCEALLSCLLC